MMRALGYGSGGGVSGLASPVVIDEAQRVPELFPTIQTSADRD